MIGWGKRDESLSRLQKGTEFFLPLHSRCVIIISVVILLLAQSKAVTPVMGLNDSPTNK